MLTNVYEMCILNSEDRVMKFFSVRDFRTNSSKIWSNLKADGEAIVTNNGKPNAILINVNEDNFEETLRAIRQAKGMMAFNSMRQKALNKGFLSQNEIEQEINEARQN